MNSWLLNLQDSNSPINDMMIFFHDFTMMILSFIIILILYIFYSMIFNNFLNRFLLQNHMIEIIWTIIPMFILIFIAIPSIKILYLNDEIYENSLTLKILGFQWYWNYEYMNFSNINFNSFLIPLNELKPFEFRLLDVDNRCILPYNIPIRTLTSSMDVIHSWTIPSLGVKMDSTPGRLNQSLIYMNRPGLFYGQCSEICGMNHSFMPITIESTNLLIFKKWLKSF